MKKNDWILAAAALAAACCLLAFQLLRSSEDPVAVVTVDGTLYGTYSLEEDRTIMINETNRLVIKNGEAVMEWADCPDQICVHHIPVSRNGESIICLPNRIVVSVQSSKKSDVDATVG